MDHVQSLHHDDVSRVKQLISLTKPGIIFGNVVTLCGGYFLEADGLFSWLSFLSVLFGMAFVIACGCVLNNYIDRDIDKLMSRTQKRPSACGLISLKFALSYAFILGVLGFLFLYIGTNLLTMLVAAIGLFTYVVAYTLWFKRSSTFGTIVGAISGAVPPVIGYTAVVNQFNEVAVVLFLILFCWQMPHFFAIAIYRKGDYKAANIPVLPLKRSMRYTKMNMMVFIVLYVAATLALSAVANTHLLYLASALIMGLVWLILGVQGFYTEDTVKWARKVFIYSIINITILSIMMMV
ncbi:heme o synthase [Fangia hongkongensis]|uniref:heme o synthase n=2 Tax=Fangia hongkongensis TaxID=270495 RepID=UPI0003806E6F|nr:heme o synthase [Fangia hongkongensis]